MICWQMSCCSSCSNKAACQVQLICLASPTRACGTGRTDACAAACIQLLCRDPAAQQISDSTVQQQLLLQAVRLQQPSALLPLALGLPAAAHLSATQAKQILVAAVTAALKSPQHTTAAGSRAI